MANTGQRRRGRGGGKRPRSAAPAGYDRQDAYYRRAKAEGMRSRAAYKLQELAQRFRLIRAGDRVLDLGCWPGGWLQVAATLAGPAGTVVGVDLRQTEPTPGCIVLRGDVTGADCVGALRAAAPGGVFDVILSDLSPPLSGVRARDEARAAELNELVLRLAADMLADGGSLLMKVFMSGETENLLRRAREQFASVRLTAAQASRKGSAEQYLVAGAGSAARGEGRGARG